MPPTYVFLIDVSYPAVHSGVLQTVADSIKASLDSLPGGERTQIGFLTYDTHLHFYNLKSTLSQPQLMVGYKDCCTALEHARGDSVGCPSQLMVGPAAAALGMQGMPL